MRHGTRQDWRRSPQSTDVPRRRRSVRRAGAAIASVAIHVAALALAASLIGRPRPTGAALATLATLAAARPALAVSLSPPRATSQPRPLESELSEPSEPIRSAASDPRDDRPKVAVDTTVDTTAGEVAAGLVGPPVDAPEPGAAESAEDDPGAVDVEAAGEAAREAAVMARIQAAKAYPDAARRRGIEGEVVVAFAIAADGSLLRVDAEPGPSHVLLEKAARDAIARAAPFPPGDVGPTEYRVTIVYKLER